MKRILSILLFFTLVTACSDFNKILKSDDNELKKNKAIEYYNNKEYLNAATLLEDVIPFYKLTPEGEMLYYYYCKSNYYLEDYYLASYYFRRFINQYPNSKYTEECQFLSAMCSVHNSPDYSLDQTETLNAIDQLQIFIDMYPYSDKIDTSNQIMDRLNLKLEKKDFEAAKLYYHTENYKAAVNAFKNLRQKYPLSIYKEDILYYLILSQYELGINSIESKKLERLEATLKSYRKFADEFPDSNKLKELTLIKEKTDNAISLLKLN
ncbi:MAG TPA: outer membrane protein assembly factor BamD [Crocinitomix sp.]|nr:outer membrane protein assembly factor BamD [Crocinitomix sp.]